MVIGKLHGQSFVEPGGNGMVVESLLIVQRCMNKFMPKHPPEPGAILQRTLCRYMNTPEHRIKQSIGPGGTSRRSRKVALGCKTTTMVFAGK